MKKIAYLSEDGRTVVVTPNPGFRDAYKAVTADGATLEAKVLLEVDFAPIDRLVGSWPVAGVIPDWAETEDEFIARIIRKDVPPTAKNITVVDPDKDIPKDRVFRDAWTIDGARVVVDMAKARVIHMTKIRRARNEKLLALDGPWMRAFGRGMKGDADEIEAQRETLRNLPQTLDLTQAATPEALAAIWPDILAKEVPPPPLPGPK